MTDKAVASSSSPVSGSSFSARAIAPQPSADAADLAAPSAAAAPPAASKPTTRKRVFTFQKRWLHTLPIIERSMPDAELDSRTIKAVRSAEDLTDTATDKSRDVIVCMLCDDASSKRELTKVWSRLNCRRGRIENHLMSKHPEFMRLLKHKKEAEGDTAVQIFLENMRSGRCNIRNEINMGLYSQLTAAGDGDGELQKRVLEDQLLGLENARKRAKLEKEEAEEYSGNIVLLQNGAGQTREHLTEADAAAAVADATATGVLHLDATMMTQWQSIFFNKLVVITGGESKAMAAMATQLWLFGANVVLTFSSLSAQDEFNTKHIGRFPDPTSDSEGGMARGGMMPTLCSLQTHADIAAWSSSLATKFQRVDYLINYADSETEKALAATAKLKPSDDASKSDKIVTTAALIKALCKSTCFPDVGDDGSAMPSNGSIVNIAPREDDDAIESLTKTMAAELEPRNVQVNSILLAPAEAEDDGSDVSDDVTTLSHSILFLLSPASRLLSGSVLRMQRNKLSSEESGRRIQSL